MDSGLEKESRMPGVTEKPAALRFYPFATGTAYLRALSLADQIFFAAGNFFLTLALARYFTPAEVAGYGIGLSLALTIQGVARGCYVVQNSVLPANIFRKRAAIVMGEHLSFMAAGTVILLSGIFFFDESSGMFLKAAFYSTPICFILYAQLDFERIVFLKHDKATDPAFFSLLYFILCGGFFIAVPIMPIDFFMILSALGLYSGFKILRLAAITGQPDFFRGWRLMRTDIRKNFSGAALGAAGYAGYHHAPLIILGAVAVPLHAAAFVAMRVLMQPLHILIRSLDVIDKNIFSAAASPHHALRQQLISYGLASAVMVCMIMLIAKPVTVFLYGAQYESFSYLLTGWAVISAIMALCLPFETALARQGKLPRFYAVRIFAGITGLLLALFLCPFYGAAGALAACLGGWVMALGSAVYLSRHILFFRSSL